MQPQRSAAQRLPMKRKTTWRRRAASGPAEASPRRPAAAPPTRRSRARPLHSSTPGWQVALSRLAAIASPADRAGQNRHAFLHPFHCTVSDPSCDPDFRIAFSRLRSRSKATGCSEPVDATRPAPSPRHHRKFCLQHPRLSNRDIGTRAPEPMTRGAGHRKNRPPRAAGVKSHDVECSRVLPTLNKPSISAKYTAIDEY